MALKINPENKGQGGVRVTPGARLYLTADKKRLVKEGDPEAASLYCSEFSSVPRAEFEALSPAKPKASAKKKAAAKKGK